MNTVGALKSHTGANGRAGRQADGQTNARTHRWVAREPDIPQCPGRRIARKQAGRQVEK